MLLVICSPICLVTPSVAYKIGEKKNDPLAIYASDIMTLLSFHHIFLPLVCVEFDKETGNVICNGIKSVIKEGYKSFPSGHTSWKEEKLVALSQIGGPVPLAS
ncbi:lipid phosphate phosphatase [Trifolium repens]|nr:lipid phosphate phosphatase [Trifolium repens]